MHCSAMLHWLWKDTGQPRFQGRGNTIQLLRQTWQVLIEKGRALMGIFADNLHTQQQLSLKLHHFPWGIILALQGTYASLTWSSSAVWRVSEQGFKVGFQAWLSHLLTVKFWSNYLMSLGFSVPFSKTKVITAFLPWVIWSILLT